MGQEWIEVIKKANTAFSKEEYSQASGLFKKVLAETKRNLRLVVILSKTNMLTVQEFALCSRVAANALLRNGQVREAEQIYLNATEALKPFISNLASPLFYRALVLSEFKMLFYVLADLYVSNQMLEELDIFVRENTPLLNTWAEEQQIMSQYNIN